jgi:hypothetical protein
MGIQALLGLEDEKGPVPVQRLLGDAAIQV